MASSLSTRAASAAASKKKYPERARARNRVARAVQRGDLIRPSQCERCGRSGKTEASHDDYARALDVERLCRPCHVSKDLPTHCSRGHEYTEGNTGRSGAWRYCLTCRRDRMREKREATK